MLGKCYLCFDMELVFMESRVYRASPDDTMYDKIDVIIQSVNDFNM